MVARDLSHVGRPLAVAPAVNELPHVCLRVPLRFAFTRAPQSARRSCLFA